MQVQRGSFYGFFGGSFSTLSCGEVWLPHSPSGLWTGVWRLLLLRWFCWSLFSLWRGLLESNNLTPLWKGLFCVPLRGALCRLSSRWRNISPISFELCYKTMSYILLNNSLSPYTLRLAYINWKLGSASSLKKGGGIEGQTGGIGVDHAIWVGWSRPGCKGVSTTTWFVVPWEGWGGWVLAVWAASTVMDALHEVSLFCCGTRIDRIMVVMVSNDGLKLYIRWMRDWPVWLALQRLSHYVREKSESKLIFEIGHL